MFFVRINRCIIILPACTSLCPAWLQTFFSFLKKTYVVLNKTWNWKFVLSILSLKWCFETRFCCQSPLTSTAAITLTLRWRHNGRDSVSNHQPHDCLLNCLFRCRSKKTSKLRATGLCAGNSPGTGEFPAQMASYAENVSIWWRHHEPTLK